MSEKRKTTYLPRMQLSLPDFFVLFAYVALLVGVAIWARQRGQATLDDFFAGGKNLPWWLVGTSMVATTFAADTPLAVTGIVATQGIAGNWIWWSLLFSGLLTVFFYAKLWKRAGILTDVAFIELRYSGKPAAFLRGFRAVYLAIPINCIILGWVTVGMSKLLFVLTGAPQWMIIVGLYVLTGVYIALSGLWGVIVTDFIQFIIAMLGSIVLAYMAVQHVGGLTEMSVQLQQLYPDKPWLTSFLPFDNPEILWSTFFIWITMMWWASWYPGAEPGGGGYVAQRMFSAKNEQHAVGATLFFNIAHYALRPWPWIVVGLATLIVFPELEDKETGYPMLMVSILPPGLLGLLFAAFLAAFISTVSTHLNWGASYLVSDVYRRFIKPDALFSSGSEAERHYVWISRLATLLIMVLAIVVSYFFDSVKQGWEMILSLGAGTGLVYLLRWYWWRINAWSEVSAMLAAAMGTGLSVYLGIEAFGWRLAFITAFSTVVWVAVTMLTSPEKDTHLKHFYEQIKPQGPGWNMVQAGASTSTLWPQAQAYVLAIAMVIGFLFGSHQMLLGSTWVGVLCIAIGIGLFVLIFQLSDFGRDTVNPEQ